MTSGEANIRPSFTKVDNGTVQFIHDQLAEKGPRAVMLYMALVRLANERRLTAKQPTISDLNYAFLASVSRINERTVFRLIPELVRIDIIRVVSKGPLSIKILKGYWPNTNGPVDWEKKRYSETKELAAALEDVPEAARPAYEAFMRTGRIPTLTPAVLLRVDGTHPKAHLLENFEPIAEQLEALGSQVSDPLKWLLKQASEMEIANIRGPQPRKAHGKSPDQARAAAILRILKSQGITFSLPGDGREALRHELGDTAAHLPNPDAEESTYIQAARSMKGKRVESSEWFAEYLRHVAAIEYVRVHGPSAADM